MKAIVVTFFTVITLSSLNAQKDLNYKPELDIYVLEVNFKKKILQDKCDCCSGFIGVYEKCNLYKIEVISVLHQQDTTVYKDSLELKIIKHVVLPTTFQDSIHFDEKVYSLYCSNSCSPKLLVGRVASTNRITDIPNAKVYAYLGGLNECRNFNLVEHFFLNLGIFKKVIYKRNKPLDKKSSFIPWCP